MSEVFAIKDVDDIIEYIPTSEIADHENGLILVFENGEPVGCVTKAGTVGNLGYTFATKNFLHPKSYKSITALIDNLETESRKFYLTTSKYSTLITKHETTYIKDTGAKPVFVKKDKRFLGLITKTRDDVWFLDTGTGYEAGDCFAGSSKNHVALNILKSHVGATFHTS